MMQKQPYESDELHALGREIRELLDWDKQLSRGYLEQDRPAAKLLLKARWQVPSRCWKPWLESHGIDRRTAYRLIEETLEPSKGDERRQKLRTWARKRRMALEASISECAASNRSCCGVTEGPSAGQATTHHTL